MSNTSVKNLYQLQSLMAAAIMRPLDNDSMQKTWLDGKDISNYVAEFIKPNKRLSSLKDWKSIINNIGIVYLNHCKMIFQV